VHQFSYLSRAHEPILGTSGLEIYSAQHVNCTSQNKETAKRISTCTRHQLLGITLGHSKYMTYCFNVASNISFILFCNLLFMICPVTCQFSSKVLEVVSLGINHLMATSPATAWNAPSKASEFSLAERPYLLN
jgi:hypothetical protein